MVRTEAMRRQQAAMLLARTARRSEKVLRGRTRAEHEGEGWFWKAISGVLAAALAAFAVQAQGQLRAMPGSASQRDLDQLQSRIAQLEAHAPVSAPSVGELALAAQVHQLQSQVLAMDEVQDWEEAARLGVARALASRPSPLAPGVEAHLAAAIVREARAADLDPLLVTAVMQQESGFNPLAVSQVGAVGLMQLMPATAGWLEKKSGSDADARTGQLFELEQNLHLGCQYLAALIRQFGSEERALVAYNMGPNAARAALHGPRAKELLAGYPRKVEQIRKRLADAQVRKHPADVLAAVSRVERATARR